MKWSKNGLQPNKHAIGSYLNRECFKKISFAAYIMAIRRIEFIPVNRANNIPPGIEVPIGKEAPGMRTFMGAGMQLIFQAGDAKLTTVRFYFGQPVRVERNFKEAFGYFVPV